MSWSGSSMVPALALAAGMVPSEHAAHDLYIRFERGGYRGNVYLNADGSYLIVQTGQDGVTHGFTGDWTAHGDSGFCIKPKESPGKCFEHMPQTVDERMTVVSSLGEVYVVCLEKGR